MNAEQIERISNEFMSRDAAYRVRIQRANNPEDLRKLGYEFAMNLRDWARFNERHGLAV